MLRNEHTALLSYSSLPGELYIFVVTGETFHAVRLPVGNAFFSQLNALAGSLQTGQGFEKSAAFGLYAKLIGPVRPYLKGKGHLVIVPDEETGLIPFESLVPDTASARFLLHDYAISYSPSLSALVSSSLLPGTADPQKVLALAPFDVPSSEREIMNIKADRVFGANASREQFLKMAGDYSIIHLATYALISDQEPSFIDFNAGKAGKKAGSRLFSRDIYGMDLDRANLVILSPCPLPEGRPATLAGMMGMARAFAHAGCPNFITSLWGTERETAGKISMKLHQYIHKG
ncbi:MAG TPA: CHAT domain-containing protein, partial [Anseongella sp.]|nr:CHAT domain-containing protein [Anseongella sp.]